MINLRILRWGNDSGLSSGAAVITRVFSKDRREVRQKRQCDDGSKDWNDVTLSQGMLENSRSWKRQEMDSLMKPSEGISPVNTSILPFKTYFRLTTSKLYE